MTNELAIVSQEEIDALAASLGASQEDLTGGGGNFLPSLKVWMEEDGDEDDAPRLKGKLFVTGMDEPVFTKEVTFRPLTQAFQWTQWDNDAKKTVNRTRLIASFKEEARDENGTVRCGKPPSKDLKDNKALQEKFKDVTTFRRVQGYVSYTGTTKDGTEVTIDNLLVGINSKGANFNPFDDEFIKKMPEKSNLWDFETKISLSKEKNGSVTYYVMHYEPDFGSKVRLTPPVFADIKGLKETMDTVNKEIDTKYYDALAAKKEDGAAIDALKTVGGSGTGRPGKFTSNLDDDLHDDIPF